MIVYDCAAAGARNLSVDSVRVSNTAVVAGAPIEVTARITSRSPVEETVSVTLSTTSTPSTHGPASTGASTGRVQHSVHTVHPGGSADVTFSTVAPEAGVFEGYVELDTYDSLPADNRRFFSAFARGKIPASILIAQHSTIEYADDAFFLARALDPFPGGSGGASPFSVTVSTYDEPLDFSKSAIVYALLRKSLPDSLESQLRDFVQAGGALVVFPCQDARTLSFLPANLVTPKTSDRAAGESFALASLDADALEAFRDEPPALYNTVRTYIYWLTDVTSTSAPVLARFDTGDPALLEADFGAGKVALFTTAPLREMTTLPASQAFLPLVHELSYRLLKSSGIPSETLAGTDVTFSGPRIVTAPDGESRLIEAGPSGAGFGDTGALGTYRVRKPDETADSQVFSVNADPLESDLSRLQVDAISGLAPGSPVLVADSLRSLEEAISSLKPVLALGDILLYAVIFIALLETFAANRAGAKKAGEHK